MPTHCERSELHYALCMANGNEKIDKTQQSERAPSSAQVANSEDSGHGDLDKIRDILFGGIYRELDRRLVRANAHLSARVHESEQESRRRIDVLEVHLKKETEAIIFRLEREFAEINETLRKTTHEHRDAFSSLEQKIAKVEEARAAGQRELRRQLLDQAKASLDELQNLRKELLATLQQELCLAEGEGEFGEERLGNKEHPRA